MKLEVTQEFHDAEADVIRKPGDILTATEARGTALLAARVCTEMPEEPDAKPAAKKPARKTTRK